MATEQKGILNGIAFHKLWWRNVHGIAGLVFVVACAIESIQFIFRRQPTMILSWIIVLSNIPFGVGMFTRVFGRRLKRLDHRKFTFYRNASWVVALLCLGLSIYAQPDFRLVNTAPYRWFFTGVYALFTLLAVLISSYEIRKHTIFVSGFFISNTTTLAILFALPVIHLIVGTPKLTTLYADYPIGNTIYIFMIFTCLVNSINTFMLGLFTSRKLYHTQYQKISGITWGGVYLTVAFIILWLQLNWQVALIFYVTALLLFLISSRIKIPVAQNQIGLLIDPRSDQNKSM